jgi:hypothetical protein
MPGRVGDHKREVRILPPPRRVVLEPDADLLLRFGGRHGHACGVGGAPKGGRILIRPCSCGQFYAYNGNRWKPMSQFQLWLRRKDLAGGIAWLFDEGRTRTWRFQPFPPWRRLLLQLRGWDAVSTQNPAGLWALPQYDVARGKARYGITGRSAV